MPRNGGTRSAKPKVPSGGTSPVSTAEASHLFWGFHGEKSIVLAVSGGPDSTALMWLAAQWRKPLKRGPKLIAITVDHGLRKEARAEARGVKKLATSLRIAHETLRWSGKKPSSGIQAAARQARYALLAKAARKVGAQYILTAHTHDDQAETVLMRLARGSGVSGLGGMRWAASISDDERLFLARPLLGISKARLIATLDGAGISYADDPTNCDVTFTRARLRASMPILAREGLTAERLVLLADRVQRIDMALHEVVNGAQQELAPGPWPRGQPIEIDLAAFADLPEEIALRLIGRAVDWLGHEGPVELGKLEALCEALEGAIYDWWLEPETAGRFRRTLAGAVVTLSRGKLTIEPAPLRRNTASPRRS